jgi:glycosyltransferase involved in cell wall biosynthesis
MSVAISKEARARVLDNEVIDPARLPYGGYKTTPGHRKRVMYVEGNPDGTIGGSFYSLLFLVKNLDRSRFEPIVVFSKANALMPAFQAAGVEVIVRPLAPPVHARSVVLRPFARLANVLLALVVEPLRLAALLRRRSVALLHLNNSIERNHPWIIAAVLARVRCITHERGINQRLSLPARLLVSRLHRVICISSAVRENLLRLGVPGGKLRTIWNGLDPVEMKVCKDRATLLAEFGLQPSTRLVGLVGNIREWKGQAVVVEAMEIVARECPDVACLLIGHHSEGDVAYLRSIEARIASAGLQGRVLITGYRANVADYVAALELLIHASILPEPFGRVLLEGMALRKPLVASRGGAVPEIVDDGSTGLLFEPGNARDLAEKLLRLLASPTESRAMGEAGYERLRTQFGIDVNAARTMAVYEDLLR